MEYQKGLLQKLSDLEYFVHELPRDSKEQCEIFGAARTPYCPLATHYIMRGAHVVFVGSAKALGGFVNTQHNKAVEAAARVDNR